MKKSFPSDLPLPENRRLRAAFSLLEILTVMTILSLLLTLLAPAISRLDSGGTGHAVDEVGGLVEQARQTAMQTGRWVWLGVADATDGGESQIALVTVGSRDGSCRTDRDNLVELCRSSRVRHVKISADGPGDAEVLGSQPGGFSFTWSVPTDQGRREVNFSKFVMGFSPRGEVVTDAIDVPAWIRVVLQSSTNPRDTLSLVVSGPSGQVIAGR